MSEAEGAQETLGVHTWYLVVINTAIEDMQGRLGQGPGAGISGQVSGSLGPELESLRVQVEEILESIKGNGFTAQTAGHFGSLADCILFVETR